MSSKSIWIAVAVSVIAAGTAFGRGAPPGVGGPPPGVTMGPPPGAAVHIPSGVAAGPPSGVPGSQGASEASAASLLGGLNAAHANANALANANANSMVGGIATYEQQMKSALSLTDPMQQANAITSARQQLALSSNKTLTSSAVTRLDQMLGIKSADPSLGTSP